MQHPAIGDHFHEMCCLHVFVVYVDAATVVTMEANAPCTFPADGDIWHGSPAAFRQRFAYGAIPGYWVRYDGRRNVEGWLEDKNPELANRVRTPQVYSGL